MTQQYIVGEFSSLLGDLQRAPGGQLSAICDLRREVEHCPLEKLSRLARDAFDLTDTICWAMLEQGDLGGFRDCSRTAIALGELANNAGLVP